jgi:predicted phosphodiesterase
MAKIFITGDIHGTISVNRLSTDGFLEGKELTKDDFVIIAGDFGLIWSGDKEDRHWLKWLNEKPWTTLFIDGNHENFDLLEAYPIEEWNGGKARKIMPYIWHLTRGQMFTLHGKKFFTFGGAASIDKHHRTEGKSWWAREMPSAEEYDEGLDILEKHGWKTDYVITHTCSTTSLLWIADKFGLYYKPEDESNRYLDIIHEKLDYKHWFFGHFHENMNLPDRQALLYDNIIQLPEE